MPGPGGPGGPHGGPGGPHHGGHGGPPPPPYHGGWHRRPGCGGCLFSFLFIISLSVAGIIGFTSLIF